MQLLTKRVCHIIQNMISQEDTARTYRNYGLQVQLHQYKNHALVLVTNTYATQAEVLDYAYEIIKIVKKVFNIELQIEPTLVE